MLLEYVPILRIECISLFVRSIRHRRNRRAVATLRIVAVLDVSFALRFLLEQIRRRAFRTRARNGTVVQREVALRIARAGEEDATARTALDQLALVAFLTFHARRLRRRALAAADLADRLAVGIAGAGEERTVAAGLQHHLLAAVLARRLRLGRDVGLQQARVLRILAIGVAGAGVELPEARALELHRLAAFIADDRLALGLFGDVAARGLLRVLALRII